MSADPSRAISSLDNAWIFSSLSTSSTNPPFSVFLPKLIPGVSDKSTKLLFPAFRAVDGPIDADKSVCFFNIGLKPPSFMSLLLLAAAAAAATAAATAAAAAAAVACVSSALPPTMDSPLFAADDGVSKFWNSGRCFCGRPRRFPVDGTESVFVRSMCGVTPLSGGVFVSFLVEFEPIPADESVVDRDAEADGTDDTDDTVVDAGGIDPVEIVVVDDVAGNVNDESDDDIPIDGTDVVGASNGVLVVVVGIKVGCDDWDDGCDDGCFEVRDVVWNIPAVVVLLPCLVAVMCCNSDTSQFLQLTHLQCSPHRTPARKQTQ